MDEDEIKALETSQETEVTDVIDVFEGFLDKLETNEEKKESAVKKQKKKEKEEKRKKKVEAIIKTAMAQRGKKYVWGATGPNSFDCSGLMLWTFKKHGYSLPRVAAAQAQTGKHLSRSELKRGDMVFFKNDKKNRSRVSHVGLYLGNGKYIHAPHTGDVVKISSLNSRFCWGVRVVK